MEDFILMAEVQAMLFIYMLVGFFAEKKGILTPVSRKGMTDLLVSILLPCMVFASFDQEFTTERMKQGTSILMVAFCLSFLALGVGNVAFNKFPQNRKTILQYGTLVANSGFAGLAVIEGAYGAEGVFLASFFIIPNRIFLWTAGVSFFQKEVGEASRSRSEVLKSVLLNPGIVAVFLGLGRMILGIQLPHFVSGAISSLGNCTAPMSLIIIGGILSHVEWKSVFGLDTMVASAVRLLFLPATALVIMNTLNFPPLETAVAVILTGMPMASTTAILAEKYGADAKFGSQCVFLTTLLSLFTVPMFTLFL